ncbi:MAG: tetratricopeptide repeat protein [Phycisphaerales bacterium]|nr:tetratricopeptide repeat protein [Phycisphaerales bacterium]
MNQVQEVIRAALQHRQEGRFDAARSLLQRAIAKEPRHPDLHHTLAVLLFERGEKEQALFYGERANELGPRRPHVLNTLAMLYGSLGRVEDSERVCREAIAIEPRYPKPYASLGAVLTEMGKLEEARGMFEKALALDPNLAECRHNYGRWLLETSKSEQAVAELTTSVRQRPQDARFQLHLASTMNYAPGLTAAQVLAAHERYGRLLGDPPPAPRPADPDPDRPLRIGFLSADFRAHSVSYFAEPILTGLDRSRFSIFCFSNSHTEDHVTERLRALPGLTFRRIVNESDDRTAEIIRQDGVDILIDLSGLSIGHRMGVIMRRPAPIQMSHIGYPNTTGVRAIDYRIVDSLTDPPGAADASAVEKLERLDPCFLCYRATAAAPEPQMPGPDAPITFGSFNVSAKVNAPLLRLWARLLEAAPGSRLLLKSKNLGMPTVRDYFLERFSQHGIDAARVDLLDRVPSTADHLALYSRLHVALDTFPYHGTTTTCEALWMGVPVVSLAGDSHVSRVGLSLLNAIGLPELSAADEDVYVKIAAELARDRARLVQLRSGLRERMRASALCDEKSYVARLEAFYRRAWAERCRQDQAKPSR